MLGRDLSSSHFFFSGLFSMFPTSPNHTYIHSILPIFGLFLLCLLLFSISTILCREHFSWLQLLFGHFYHLCSGSWIFSSNLLVRVVGFRCFVLAFNIASVCMCAHYMQPTDTFYFHSFSPVVSLSLLPPLTQFLCITSIYYMHTHIHQTQQVKMRPIIILYTKSSSSL